MSIEGELLRALMQRSVRFVAIGVWAANQYAKSIAQLFATEDKDLFLPPDADNLLGAWEACSSVGLELLSASEPLDEPRDSRLAQVVVQRRALTRATDGKSLLVDLSLTMAGFDFEAVWSERRSFLIDGIEFPVARLTHIVQSKALAGRPKDRLFLATHAEMLLEMERREQERGPRKMR